MAGDLLGGYAWGKLYELSTHVDKAYYNKLLAARQDFLKLRARLDPDILAIYKNASNRLQDMVKHADPKKFMTSFHKDYLKELQAESELIANTTQATLKTALKSTIAAAAAPLEEGWKSVTANTVLKGAVVDRAFQKLNAAAVEAIWTRSKGGLRLSDRIWNQAAGYKTNLNRLIVSGVALGRDPVMIARDIEGYIQDGAKTLAKDYPNMMKRMGGRVPGNISYEALRTARTEVSAAYLEGTYSSGEASPVYNGVLWLLSGSHPIADICDTLASADLYGLGPGRYPAGQEPAHPHPQCLCTVVPIPEDFETMKKRLQGWLQDSNSDPRIDSWYHNMYLPLNRIEITAPRGLPIKSALEVMAKYVSGKSGSNPGGIYEGSDGEQYFIKFYKESAQAYNEVIANQLYNDLGLRAPDMFLVENDGKWAVGSRAIPGIKELGAKGLDQAMADRILDGYVADVWLQNWDTIGLGLDNIVIDSTGNIIRIDNGGALLFRAQGSRKPLKALTDISEIEGFTKSAVNPSYAKVWKAAGIGDPQDLGERALAQLDAIKTLREKSHDFADYILDLKGVAEADRQQILAMLRARADALEDSYRPAVVARMQMKAKALLAAAEAANVAPPAADLVRTAPLKTDLPKPAQELGKSAQGNTSAALSGNVSKLTANPAPGAPLKLDGVTIMSMPGMDPKDPDNYPDMIAYFKAQTDKALKEPPLKVPKGKTPSTGIILVTDDGRVVINHPKGGYGGYDATFPKGKWLASSKLTYQQNALKEVWEETGLVGDITGYLGDFEKNTSMTRYYIGRVKSGAPWMFGEETEAVSILDFAAAKSVLNTPVDQAVLAALEKKFSNMALNSALDTVTSQVMAFAGVKKGPDPAKSAAIKAGIAKKKAERAALEAIAGNTPMTPLAASTLAEADVPWAAITHNGYGDFLRRDGSMVENQNIFVRRIVMGDKKGYQLQMKITAENHDALIASIKAYGNESYHYTFPSGRVTKARGFVYGDETLWDIADKHYVWNTTAHQVEFWPSTVNTKTLAGSLNITVWGDEAAAQAALANVSSKLHIQNVFKAVDAQSEYQMKLIRYLYQNSPSSLTAGAKSTAWLEQEVLMCGGNLQEVRNLELRNVFNGYQTYYSEAMAKRLEDEGAAYLWAGVGRNSSRVVSMMTGNSPGYMSLFQRMRAGSAAGSSVSSDFKSGGADNVFVRLAMKNQVGKAHFSSSFAGSDIRVIFDVKELGRTDWYAYTSDNFGSTVFGYQERNSALDIMRILKGSYHPSNEFMFRNGIRREAITGLVVDSHGQRAELLELFRNKGIRSYNGVAIEDFITVRSTL